ncbi:fasciclin arabinogalactan protein [Trifolium repens]|nr:fasciclin arabinogalactan protein [Trifolium repens]
MMHNNIWQTMIFPVKRLCLALSTTINHRKNGAGLVKLQDDVQTCEYEDALYVEVDSSTQIEKKLRKRVKALFASDFITPDLFLSAASSGDMAGTGPGDITGTGAGAETGTGDTTGTGDFTGPATGDTTGTGIINGMVSGTGDSTGTGDTTGGAGAGACDVALEEGSRDGGMMTVLICTTEILYGCATTALTKLAPAPLGSEGDVKMTAPVLRSVNFMRPSDPLACPVV